MKKITSKLVAVLVIVVMAFGISGTATVKTEAKESKGYVIKVNLGTNCTTVYKNGKAIKAMICSPSNETPTGTFYTPVKYRWHEMIGNCYAQYCTRITTGILFHSVWYYKNGDKSTMSVKAYNVMGQKASHGCVRLLCKDSKWIYDHCALGTKVIIFRGTKKDDPIKRPSFTPITNGKFTDWDPTDPDPKNPYKSNKPVITAKVKTIEYGTKVKLSDLITVKDRAGNVLTKKNAKITTVGKIKTSKLGKYKIKFKVKDSLGNSKTKTLTFKVVDTKKPVISGAVKNPDVALNSSVNVLANVTAKTAAGKNITSKIKVTVKYNKKKVKIKNGVVKFANKGKYYITYKVTGKNKKTAKKTIKYVVKDHKVSLTMKNTTVKVKQNSTFNPLNYVASVKDYKGNALNIKNSVTVTGKVDTKKPGTYTLTYKAQYLNQAYTARTATLKVVVEAVAQQPTTKPVTTQPTTKVPETTTKAPETTTKAPEITTVPETTTSK